MHLTYKYTTHISHYHHFHLFPHLFIQIKTVTRKYLLFNNQKKGASGSSSLPIWSPLQSFQPLSAMSEQERSICRSSLPNVLHIVRRRSSRSMGQGSLLPSPASATQPFIGLCPNSQIKSVQVAGLSNKSLSSTHSGVITNAGGKVIVKKMAGQNIYKGSNSNGVRSLSLPKWRESFVVTGNDSTAL